MAIKWVLEPQGAELSEKAWTSSCDEQGKIVLTKNIVGAEDSVKNAYETHVQNAGNYVDLEQSEGAPLSGRFLVLGAQYQTQSPGIGSASLNFGTLPGGIVSSGENATDADNSHFETAEFQNMEQPIRLAKFWRDAMQISETGDYQERERNSWKAVQLFIDGAGTYDEIQREFDAFITASGVNGQRQAINKMISKRLSGIESFYVPAPVLSVTDVLTSFPADFGADLTKVLTDLGMFTKISVPDGFEWLGMSDTITFDGTTFRRERSYTGAEFWDEDLYQRKG